MSQAFPQPKAAGNQLLAAYSRNLIERPIRTKAITSGTLFFLQEVLSDYFAGTTRKAKRSGNPIVDTLTPFDRAIKFALYGALINAPVSHYLVEWLQKAFAGQTGAKAKILQILAANLVVLPVVLAGYIGASAVVNGAKTIGQVINAVKANFRKAYRVSFFTNPMSVIFAQRFIAPQFWTSFFALVSFIRGTQISTASKSAIARAKSL